MTATDPAPTKPGAVDEHSCFDADRSARLWQA
jgi:hypothetical protein